MMKKRGVVGNIIGTKMPKDTGLLESCCEDLTFVLLYYRVQGASNVKRGCGETLAVQAVVVLHCAPVPRECWPKRLSRNELTGNP